MTFEEKLTMVPTEYATAKEIGLAAASLGAMVRRGLIEATNTSPKQYRRINGPAAKIYSLLDQYKPEFFTLRKEDEKIGMLCSYKNNTILDCWDKPYNLNNVSSIEIKNEVFNL